MSTKTIGIMGQAYSGSTLLSLLLGSSPSVFAAGEPFYSHARDFNLNCAFCGVHCPFWTRDFLSDCARNESKLYDGVAARAKNLLGASVTVFSDKDPLYYFRAVSAGNKLDGVLLLFKSPGGHAYSFSTHKNRGIKKSLDEYAEAYEQSIKVLNHLKLPYFPVSYDELAGNTAACLRRICASFEIPYSPEMLRFWEKKERFHPLSGNYGLHLQLEPPETFEKKLEVASSGEILSTERMTWLRAVYRTITVDERWKINFDGADLGKIESHRKSREIYENMLDLAGREP